MGRRAGVTPEETRQQLLDAATSVFARLGYDGASISDITAEAGLSRGALYSSFSSKAELFAAVLRRRDEERILAKLADTLEPGLAGMIKAMGHQLNSPDRDGGDLLIEGLVSAKRDPGVAELVREWFTRNEAEGLQMATGMMEAGAPLPVDPAALARLGTMLLVGSLLVSAIDLPPVDPDAWSRLIDVMVNSALSD